MWFRRRRQVKSTEQLMREGAIKPYSIRPKPIVRLPEQQEPIYLQPGQRLVYLNPIEQQKPIAQIIMPPDPFIKEKR